MEKRDKRGLTEAEYLAQYKPGRYPQPSLTVDIILLAHAEGALRVLLVRRGGHPYLGCWALPGGFAEPQETTAQAAARELADAIDAQLVIPMHYRAHRAVQHAGARPARLDDLPRLRCAGGCGSAGHPRR